ncbi:substrate import-associated zinc metallohydrolase lipoprotein [Sphingobacterium nematocida]|uniref:Substrate import-associated zinc metallohydrolase lipoprotein n=1 Tax=Sphingobacterium nematocida TaxID=1513896 RepID=A0A1T5DPA1_9SPHI|nr:substrate import-associated zinc metallohydrolase lipoprotein [Sphingobacterium nematocida]SKB73558.1 substrate import-associated zinc metallohydrolase lipoprotein [Sphingobacterium nematocida]
MKLKLFTIVILTVILGISGCRKSDENLDVDLSKYNYDNFEKLPVDDYIYTNLTKPYNIEVVYRFDRSHTDIAKNISPPNIDRVQPAVDMILTGFIKPYEKLGGARMIKVYTPKQFVLFGSHAYNDNGSVTLGTADGGRRVVLYDINNISKTNGVDIKRRLRTIHHEFTHILNQMVAIPPSFRTITADHVDNWLAAENTDAEAKRLGFVSRYARSSFGEDFAEMVAHLLIEGQVWFDNYVAEIPDAMYRERIRLKETVIREYFSSFFQIDFTELQIEMQRVLKEEYNTTPPSDRTQELHFRLMNNKINTIRYTANASYLTQYGDPAAIKAILANVQTSLRTTQANGIVDYFEFRFTDAENLIFRIGYRNSSTTAALTSDYYFKMVINPVTGEVSFVKSTVNGAHFAGNGSVTMSGFETYVLPYLTNRIFIASWLPASIPATSPLYRTYGGFYVKGTPANYIYGPVVLK